MRVLIFLLAFLILSCAVAQAGSPKTKSANVKHGVTKHSMEGRKTPNKAVKSEKKDVEKPAPPPVEPPASLVDPPASQVEPPAPQAEPPAPQAEPPAPTKVEPQTSPVKVPHSKESGNKKGQTHHQKTDAAKADKSKGHKGKTPEQHKDKPHPEKPNNSNNNNNNNNNHNNKNNHSPVNPEVYYFPAPSRLNIEFDFLNDDHDTSKTNVSLLVVILSYASEVAAKARQAVRDTWLQWDTAKVQHVFLVGDLDLLYDEDSKADIIEEAKQFNDIVFLPGVDDGYERLTTKVFKGFKYTYENYEFDFLVKCDTDTFVRIPKLLRYLDKVPRTRAYIGQRGKTPYRDDFMPPNVIDVLYMQGGGYILSNDLVKYFAENEDILVTWFAEDVTVGYHLSMLKVEWISHKFDVIKADAISRLGCERSIVINHKCSTSDHYYMWGSIADGRDHCAYTYDQEYRVKLQERYNITDDKTLKFNWGTIPPMK